METKWTPGVWLATPDGNGEWGVDTDDGWGIATVAANAGMGGENGFTDGNDHLIADAPDLYAALEAMRTVMDMGECPTKLDEALTWRQCDEKARAMCDAALAKARGEA